MMRRKADHCASFPASSCGAARPAPHPGPGRAMTAKVCCRAGHRGWLRQRGISAVIPVQGDEEKYRRNRGRAGGRPRRAAGAGRHAPR
jgi:hypothetical protein